VRKHIISLVTLLCLQFVSITYASETALENSVNNSFIFWYSESPQSENATTNYFIREIAKYNLTSLYNTSFTFQYTVNNSIQNSAPNTCTITVDLIGQKCTGDVFYKGFDISDVLMPQKADFNVILVCENNYVDNRRFEGIKLDENGSCKMEYDFDVPDESQKFSLKFEKIKFYSTNEAEKRFDDRIAQIDDYYASVALMDQILNEFTDIETRRNSLIDLYLYLRELERLYVIVSNEPFIRNLDISNNDFAGYFQKLASFKNQLVRYTEYFEILLKSTDKVCFYSSLNQTAGVFVKTASMIIMHSQTVTHSQSNYIYNLGLIDYSSVMIKRFKKDMKRIISKTDLAGNADYLIERFSNEVYDSFIREASNLINDQNYLAALGMLHNAQRFYNSTKNTGIPTELTILISRANYGIYDSYLLLINKAIDLGNYELAGNYIAKAKSFRDENRRSIIVDDYLTGVSEKLILLYITRGNQLNQNEEFQNAVECFERAGLICQKIKRFNYQYDIDHGLICSRNGLYNNLLRQAETEVTNENYSGAKILVDKANELFILHPAQIIPDRQYNQLLSAINYNTFKQLIIDGGTVLNNGNYNLAYEILLEAIELQEKSNFEYDCELAELFSVAASPVLNDMCSLGEVKIKRNQLTEARKIYDQCINLQKEYGLIYEAGIQENLTKLNNNIFEKHCETSHTEFNQIIDSFYLSVRLGDYVNAVNVLDAAEKISLHNYYCEIDRDYVIELREKYSPLAKYQILAQDAKDALITKDFQRFPEIYQQLEYLCGNYEMIRKQLEPLPLYCFFSVKKNLELFEALIDSLNNRQDFYIAISLLAVTEKNNLTINDIKSIQRKIGNKMAILDKNSNSLIDPLVLAEEYTSGKPHYKYFTRAYLPQRFNFDFLKISKKDWFVLR